jgi:hypothetical protein
MRTSKKPPAVTSDENASIASERLRISSILESAEGKRNPAMAQKLALYSALDAETAKSILAEAPSANPYLAAMELHGPIGIGASPNTMSSDPKATRLAEIEANVAAFNAVRGYAKPGKQG